MWNGRFLDLYWLKKKNKQKNKKNVYSIESNYLGFCLWKIKQEMFYFYVNEKNKIKIIRIVPD